MTNTPSFRCSRTVKWNRAEISLKRCPEQNQEGVTNDKLTFMACGYPGVSVQPGDETLWHSRVNEIIVSLMSASLMFYFASAHIMLCWKGICCRTKRQEGFFTFLRYTKDSNRMTFIYTTRLQGDYVNYDTRRDRYGVNVLIWTFCLILNDCCKLHSPCLGALMGPTQSSGWSLCKLPAHFSSLFWAQMPL